MLKQILITNLDVSYIIILSRVMRAAPHIKKKWPFDQYFSLHPLPGVFAHLKLKDREKVVVGFIKIPFQRIFQEFVKRIMRRPNGIFSVLLAMRRCRERGKTEFYLVTADSHPCKSRTRTFDLIIQGTKRGLFSEITHQTTQLFAIIFMVQPQKTHPEHLWISCEVRLISPRSLNSIMNFYALETFMHWSRTNDQYQRCELIYKKSCKHFLLVIIFHHL